MELNNPLFYKKTTQSAHFQLYTAYTLTNSDKSDTTNAILGSKFMELIYNAIHEHPNCLLLKKDTAKRA